MLHARETARAAREWAAADGIRAELRAAGISLNDRTRTWRAADGRTGPFPSAAAAGTGTGAGTAAEAPEAPARAPQEPPASSTSPSPSPSPSIPERNIRPRQARLIHGHEHVAGRWRELAFVVAGGGVKQALVLARQLLADPRDATHLTVLSVNRSRPEIPCFQELRDLQTLYPSRVRVAFALTSPPPDTDQWTGFVGRGDAAMGRAALPSPLCGAGDGDGAGDHDGDRGSDGNGDGGSGGDGDRGGGGGGRNRGVMVIVCGKVQGDKDCEAFVELWGGGMGQKLATKGRSRMQRVQGPVGGILKEIGFTSDQVFQI